MKKILIVLITLLCINSFIFKKDISANTIYTNDDFKVDYIYHFKQADELKWNDDSSFDIKIVDKEYDVIINEQDTTSYTFETDMDLIVYIYSYGIDEHYVVFHHTYNVTYDLMGKGENFIRQSNVDPFGNWARRPDMPTYDGYMFEGWYFEDSYETPVEWDDYGECEINDDITLYAKWSEVTLKCIETKGDDQSLDNQEITIQIIPIANNERIYDVSLLEEKDRPIIIGSLENTYPLETFIIEYDEDKDGYFYTYTLDENKDEYKFLFCVKNNISINTEYIVNVVDVECEDVLENHGYPWASNFTNNEDINTVTLNTNLLENSSSVSYQWQSSNNNADYYDIRINGNASHLKLFSNHLFHDWYRCKVTYKQNDTEYVTYTKAIQIIDSTKINDQIFHSINTKRNVYKVLQGLYVGNGEIYYCLGDDNNPQFFNILSKYNNGIKDYYISSAFDESWTIYMKNHSNDNFIDTNNIKSIRFVFNDTNPNLIDAYIKTNRKCDIAIYTDLCLADHLDVYYADLSATKAVLDSDMNLKEIQMVANIDFKTAKLQDNPGMIIRPINSCSSYTIDTFLNGPYHNVDDSHDDYEYIVNDYRNEDALTYKDIFEILKTRIYDYNHGITPTFMGDNDPFIYYKKLNGEKIVIGMYCKDNVMALSWKDTDEVKFTFGLGNAINLGISNNEIYDIVEKQNYDHDDEPKEKELPFVIPKTCIE